jgi:hypothetical protein
VTIRRAQISPGAAPFHGTSARETGECAAADEDAASSTARLGARRDQQISVDILSVMEDG